MPGAFLFLLSFVSLLLSLLLTPDSHRQLSFISSRSLHLLHCLDYFLPIHLERKSSHSLSQSHPTPEPRLVDPPLPPHPSPPPPTSSSSSTTTTATTHPASPLACEGRSLFSSPQNSECITQCSQPQCVSEDCLSSQRR